MFKYLGQHIFDFVSKFRNDVYFQNLEELDQNFSIVVGPDGKLSKSKSPAEKSIIEVRNDEGSVIPAGAPLYSKGEIGGSDRIKVGICDASDPAKMPCIGIAQVEMNTSDTKDNFAITQGVYNTNISGFTGLSEGDTLYVNGGSAPYLVSTKPSNGNYIQNVGIVLKTNGTICQGLLVSAIGRTNDVPWPLYVDVPNSRVGIGTTSPSSALQVVGDGQGDGILVSNVDGYNVGRIYNNNSNAFPVGNLTLSYGNTTPAFINAESNGISIRGGATDTAGNNIKFRLYTSEKMRLTPTGLGIGTTSPAGTLHVVGTSGGAGEIYVSDVDNGVGSSDGLLISKSGTNAFIYNRDNGQISFGTNNVSNNLVITNTGNVGIGTTSPSGALHVNQGTGDAVTSLYTNTYGTVTIARNHSTNPYIQTSFVSGQSALSFYQNSNLYTKISVGDSYFNGGNVGIGTTSPTEPLTVEGNISGSGNLTLNGNIYKAIENSYLGLYGGSDNTNSDGFIKIHGDSNYWGRVQTNIGYSSANSKAYWTLANSTELMTLTGAGRLGIGATSPKTIVDIRPVGITGLTMPTFGTTAYGGIHIVPSGTATTEAWYGITFGNTASGPSERERSTAGIYTSALGSYGNKLYFATSNSWSTGAVSRMMIDHNGNVGIGTTSPTYQLDIYESGSTQPIRTREASTPYRAFEVNYSNTYATQLKFGLDGEITYDGNGGRMYITNSGGNVTNNWIRFVMGSTTAMHIAGDGDIGIGTTSPNHKLDVSGDINIPLGSNYLRFGGELGIKKVSNGAMHFYAGTNSTTGGFDFATWNGSSYNEGSFVIRNNGNVGISTTSPTDLLHIRKDQNAPTQIRVENASNTSNSRASITVGTAGNAITMARYLSNYTTVSSWANRGGILTDSGLTDGFFFRTSAGAISFQPGSNTDSVVFDTSGNVGIGNTSPATKIDVDGTGRITDTVYLSTNANSKTGIGTTSPTEKLEVSGNIKASGTIKGKMEQMFACSFSDDLGTTKHYLSFTSNAEQTNVHADQAAMVMPYNGRVKSIQMRLSNIDADTIRTFGIETIAPGINMYAASNNWTIEETEAYELAATDDFYLVNYVFSNTSHFESGDLLAISIQDAEDAYTASRQTYITVIIEYDLNNGMGNDTATTKYTS